MEIDPKKMNFDKMKSSKNSNGETRTNQVKGIDGINYCENRFANLFLMF